MVEPDGLQSFSGGFFQKKICVCKNPVYLCKKANHMKKQFVTPAEAEVIENIINSEYMAPDGPDIVNFPVWTFTATNENKRLAAALGSLVKKGLCETDENTAALTANGYEWAKKHGLVL